MATYLSLKTGCRIHSVESGPNLHEYVVETPDKRLYKLSKLSREIIEKLESGNSLEDVCGLLSQQYPGATAEELRACVADMYRPILTIQGDGCTAGPQDATQPLWKRNMLFVQLTIIPERWVTMAARYLTFLYRPVAIALLLSTGIAAHALCYWSATNLSHTLVASTSITLLLCLLSVILHELGHSSALLDAGGSPGGIGIGMFMLMPVFFANVSQIWILPKKSRITVDLGGIYFQQIAFTIFAVAAAITHLPSFHAACIAIDVMCLIAINPAFRFDGYWVLADWLGVPRLHAAAQKFLKDLTKKIFLGRNAEDLVPAALGKAKAITFIAYAFLGNGFLAAAVLINLRSVRAGIIRASQNIPRLFHQFTFACGTKDWPTAINSSVSLWFVCAFLVAIIAMTGIYIYRAGRTFTGWCRTGFVSPAPSKENF